MPPTLAEVTSRLADLDLQYRLGRDAAGHLVVQIVLREDGADDPLPAPASPMLRSRPEPARESPADSAPQLPPPRARVARVEDLPRAAQASVGRLAAAPGRPGGRERLLRAAAAGFTDREVYDGLRRYPESVAPLLAPLFRPVLLSQRGDGPWICRTRAAFVDAVGDPISDKAVCRSFPSEVETLVYFWAAGWDYALPAEWRLP